MADGAKYKTTFDIVDGDHDGYITAEEFHRLVEMRGDEIPPAKVAAFVARFDANGDGRISLDEFAELMEQGIE